MSLGMVSLGIVPLGILAAVNQALPVFKRQQLAASTTIFPDCQRNLIGVPKSIEDEW
jgi:hypothetical protein